MSPELLNWVKIGLVLLCTAALMIGLSAYQRRYDPHPEWVRKLMHMGSGVIALSLPWLFEEPWPVLVLAILASSGMIAVKYLNSLRDNVGQVTGGVLRDTIGEICFPLGAAMIFILADGDILLYSIPILILTFADASAALIGIFYGVFRYTTSDGTKTIEGSLAFFQTALMSTLVLILVFTEIGRVETLLISLLMALLSMLLDAVAWWGLDNFLIPVLSFLMLRVFVGLDAAVLLLQLLVTVAMILFVLIWRRRTTLNDSAVLGTVIYGYLCWTLGGWQWVLPPLLLFLSYNVLSPQDVPKHARPYTVQVMLGVGAVGLFWLILADSLGSTALFFPFMVSFVAQLAMIGSSRTLRASEGVSTYVLLIRSIVVSWLIYFIPFVLIADLPDTWWLYLAAGLLGIGAGAAMFAISQAGPGGYRNAAPRWLVQTLSAGLASLLGLAALQIA